MRPREDVYEEVYGVEGKRVEEHSGAVVLVMGPMFSGKTTELLRRLERHRMARRRVVLVKYARDQRYGGEAEAATHCGMRAEAVGAVRLAEADEAVASAQVVGVDEGQFFPDLVEAAERWAAQGKVVVVAALDGDFQRRPFARVAELVPRAEEVVKLRAVCLVCCGEAAFTRRLGTETQLEVIGGADKYIAVCRRCYHADERLARRAAQQGTPPPLRAHHTKRVLAATPSDELTAPHSDDVKTAPSLLPSVTAALASSSFV
jgi:thymidine kinase